MDVWGLYIGSDKTMVICLYYLVSYGIFIANNYSPIWESLKTISHIMDSNMAFLFVAHMVNPDNLSSCAGYSLPTRPRQSSLLFNIYIYIYTSL